MFTQAGPDSCGEIGWHGHFGAPSHWRNARSARRFLEAGHIPWFRYNRAYLHGVGECNFRLLDDFWTCNGDSCIKKYLSGVCPSPAGLPCRVSAFGAEGGVMALHKWWRFGPDDPWGTHGRCQVFWGVQPAAEKSSV